MTAATKATRRWRCWKRSSECRRPERDTVGSLLPAAAVPLAGQPDRSGGRVQDPEDANARHALVGCEVHYRREGLVDLDAAVAPAPVEPANGDHGIADL